MKVYNTETWNTEHRKQKKIKIEFEYKAYIGVDY